MRNSITLLYPSTVDVQAILEGGLNLSYNKNDFAKQNEHIRIVIDKFLKARSKEQVRKNDFSSGIEFPFCAEVLRNALREHRPFIDSLVDYGFIWPTTTPKKGSCTNYIICDDHKDSAIEEFRIYKTGSKRKDLTFKALISSTKSEIAAKEKYKYQYEVYKNVSVDFEIAEKLLDRLYQSNPVQRQIQLEKLEKIDEFGNDEGIDIGFKVGSTGRLYNTFSNIKKELRFAIRINGMSLWEIDLKNSIPLMSIGLWQPHNAKIKEIYDKVGKDYLGEESYEGILPIIHCKKRHEGETKEQIEGYITNITNGKIYDYLKDRWGLETRKKSKNIFLTMLNSPPVQLYGNCHWSDFSSIYPEIARVVERINQDFTLTKKQVKQLEISGEDIKCYFAYLTQGVESYLILDLVGKILESLKVPFITLHDAIYTIGPYASLVEEALKAQVLELLQVNPVMEVNQLEDYEEALKEKD